MNSRERVIAALSGRIPDRVPVMETIIDWKVMRGLGYGDYHELVEELEEYYRQNGSWEGADAIMPRSEGGGSGAGSPQQGLRRLITLRLADVEWTVVYDPVRPEMEGTRTDPDEANIPLHLNETIVGYLLPQEGSYTQENEQFEEQFLGRINNASLVAAAI